VTKRVSRTPNDEPNSATADDRSSVVFDRNIENTGEARSWITAFLVEHGGGDALRDDAALVVSELVTNALRHGAGAVVVRASFIDRRLNIAVTDSGDALPHQLPIDTERIGGLGLHIVERVSGEWGVSPFPGGKTVWAVLTDPEANRPNHSPSC
jgi:anti-sigma regulatory factor (Ser/Thr protein kinase)